MTFCEKVLTTPTVRLILPHPVALSLVGLGLAYLLTITGFFIYFYWPKQSTPQDDNNPTSVDRTYIPRVCLCIRPDSIAGRFLGRLGFHPPDQIDQSITSASPNLVFPFYNPILIANALVNISVGLVTLLFDLHPFDDQQIRNDDRYDDDSYDKTRSLVSIYVFAVLWAIQHVVVEGVAVLLMQKGVGVHAATRSLKLALIWGSITLLSQIGIYQLNHLHRLDQENDDDTNTSGGGSVYLSLSFSINIIWQSSLLIFYVVLWLFPQKRLYRRPSVIMYACIWTIFRLMNIVAAILVYLSQVYSDSSWEEDEKHKSNWGWKLMSVSNCFYLFGCLYVFALFEPILLYYTLLQDSRWWQGLHVRIGFGHKVDFPRSSTNSTIPSNRGSNYTLKNEESITSPLYGIEVHPTSAQSLAKKLDNLPESSVRLLNFSLISLDKHTLLGSGSFSKVYLARYRKSTCACKLIYTIDLTESMIRRVAAEAELLSQIRHENVVKIIGVSVMPPSVCLLLELCFYGSLADVVHKTGFEHHLYRHKDNTRLGMIDPNLQNTSFFPQQYKFLQDFYRGEERLAKFSARRLAISWCERLTLALGCARGLAALHSYSPFLCHRDIKSFNFLVDQNLIAKVSDLELGVMNHEEKKTEEKKKKKKKVKKSSKFSTPVKNPNHLSTFSISEDRDSRLFDASLGSSYNSNSNIIKDLEASNEDDSDYCTEDDEELEVASLSQSLRADEFLANWAAPEVISGAKHTQASDVYSFGMVLWELLSGAAPFSEVRKQDEVRHKVILGDRPHIPHIFYGSNIDRCTTPPNASFSPNAANIHLADTVFAPYIHLIERCWSTDPEARPTSNEVEQLLEMMLKQYCYSIFHSTDCSINTVDINISNFTQIQQHLQTPNSQHSPNIASSPNILSNSVESVSNSFSPGSSLNQNNTLPNSISGPTPKGSISSWISSLIPSWGRRYESLTEIQVNNLLDQLRQEDPLSGSSTLDLFEARGEAWAFILPTTPLVKNDDVYSSSVSFSSTPNQSSFSMSFNSPNFIFLWCTSRFQQIAQMPLSNFYGQQFQDLPIFHYDLYYKQFLVDYMSQLRSNQNENPEELDVNINKSIAFQCKQQEQQLHSLISHFKACSPDRITHTTVDMLIQVPEPNTHKNSPVFHTPFSSQAPRVRYTTATFSATMFPIRSKDRNNYQDNSKESNSNVGSIGSNHDNK